MKNRFFLLAMMLILPMLSMASCHKSQTPQLSQNIVPDSTVLKILGDTVADVLFNPKIVKCYLIANREKKNDKEVEVAECFVRDSLIGNLKSEIITILQFNLLADEENYKNDTLVVKSPYRPILEFVFQKKKEEVHVVVSVMDHTWSIVRNNNIVCKYNYANQRLQYRLFAEFLNKPNK